MKFAIGLIGAALMFAGSTASAPAQGFDRDCSDFRSWEEAQQFYETQGRGDPHRLGADSDGIACETLR